MLLRLAKLLLILAVLPLAGGLLLCYYKETWALVWAAVGTGLALDGLAAGLLKEMLVEYVAPSSIEITWTGTGESLSLRYRPAHEHGIHDGFVRLYVKNNGAREIENLEVQIYDVEQRQLGGGWSRNNDFYRVSLTWMHKSPNSILTSLPKDADEWLDVGEWQIMPINGIESTVLKFWTSTPLNPLIFIPEGEFRFKLSPRCKAKAFPTEVWHVAIPSLRTVDRIRLWKDRA